MLGGWCHNSVSLQVIIITQYYTFIAMISCFSRATRWRRNDDSAIRKRETKGNEAEEKRPRTDLRRSLLGNEDLLRDVVWNDVGRAECDGTLKLFTHPRRVENVFLETLF